jgi:hypothetical protein
MNNVIDLHKKPEIISFTFPTSNFYLIEQCKRDMIEFADKKFLYYVEKQGFTTLVFLK